MAIKMYCMWVYCCSLYTLCLLPCIQFHGQQLDKARKTGLDAMDRQDFLKLQIKEMNARKRGSRNEEKDMINKNMELLKVS